ncbi:hypothetical protein AUJ83_01270 [Candidatus Woesearchaeota archaeon CG1_02_33_12]|nr:MAG: hypothetical protein AUJ83_01270 [Candidatus Woesearchaeota archaeon CG1_02_33_12]PIN77500.1 MAG: hypothetical protein COV14_05885 [Candidatus Woesearchaeota archaeon CG10_big_fil_rev_8_21_14_0_10_33_12]PIU72036.1 MAG: hypothetical protein COS79_04920 [Candidatus Woesearchaeota archaeon CG06_land_8_20_14_3_00_33_13]
MTNVYHSNDENKFLLKLKQELRERFKDCDKIAIKLHFGEPGNKTAFKPEDIKPITDILNELDINFFLFDSLVTYSGPRNNSDSYKNFVIKKGWDKLGEIRINDEHISVKGENLTYEVCKELVDADAVLVVSHVKGHVCTGFGGAIKNLGMGALTKKTKSDIHYGGEPVFVGKCTQCKACERACPLETLKVKDKPIFGTCYGCSDCVYACPNLAIKTKVNYFDILLAEGAFIAQSKFKKVYYISFLKNITQLCDCESDSGKIIANDCGFLASHNGVAIDMAAYDIILKNEGQDVFLKFNKKSGTEQVKAAEKFGMGQSKYNLIEL